MTERPNQNDGQLVVAAVRVLEHVEQHPPNESEIAALLRWHEDRARVVANALVELGALAVLRSPFDVRFQLADVRLVDELPVEEVVGDTISREMADFEQRSRSEQEHLEQLFGKGKDAPKAPDPSSSLADEFGRFRRKKPTNPFGDG